MFESGIADLVAGDVNLNTGAAVLQLDKGGFTKIPPRHHPAGDMIALVQCFQLLFIIVLMASQYLLGRSCHTEIIGKRVDTGTLVGGNLAAPLYQQIVQIFHFFQILARSKISAER